MRQSHVFHGGYNAGALLHVITHLPQKRIGRDTMIHKPHNEHEYSRTHGPEVLYQVLFCSRSGNWEVELGQIDEFTQPYTGKAELIHFLIKSICYNDKNGKKL